MKKLKYIILMSCLLMLSGCIKNYNTMTIKNDKSMTFESEILIADDLKEGMTEAFDRESYENAGFTISEAKIEGYSGYKFTKKYDNIDKYSNSDGATFVISDILEGQIDDKVMFKLEKGFLKNTYTATFKYSVDTDEYTNDNTIDIDESENDTANIDSSNNNDSTNTDINDEDVNVEETDTDEENINDLISLANEMEFNYKLILPSKAISNNATKVSDDGKTLTWDLIAGESDINFSFSLLNITNILILGGSIVAIIILIIVMILMVYTSYKISEKIFNKKEF